MPPLASSGTQIALTLNCNRNPNPNPNSSPNPNPNPNAKLNQVPGGGLGFDREGHWVGEEQGAAEMARLRRLERER